MNDTKKQRSFSSSDETIQLINDGLFIICRSIYSWRTGKSVARKNTLVVFLLFFVYEFLAVESVNS